MKVGRKIIFETVVGSRLYGTNSPESDMDFMGIFLPSTEDVLGLENPPTEWSKDEKISTGARNIAGDVDRKYYSLKRYLSLLAEGQSIQLEMLFSPRQMWLTPGRPMRCPWSTIIQNRELFVSKGSIMPFIGFAKAQAYKATVKGENLKILREIIHRMTLNFEKEPSSRHLPISDYISSIYRDQCTFLDYPHVKHIESETRPGVTMSHIEIAGRKFEFTQKAKDVYNKLIKLEERYGTRSEAAAESGYDYKSIMHAYRLLFEAKMLLTEGKLILPLPIDTVNFLKTIRAGEYKADFFIEIEEQLTEIRELKEKSSLQESVDRGKINELCHVLMHEHLLGI